MAREPGQEQRFILIGRIASGLAHELSGPIGIALGFSELARETIARAGLDGLDAEGTKKVNEYLGLVESAGFRARTLARQIWSFAKTEPGTTSTFDLAEVLSEAASLSAPAVKVAQIEISSRSDATGVSPVTGDRALLTQELVRLFLDSAESLPKGGNVYWEISGQENGQYGFTLAAEPWGDVPSANWPVTESTREAFCHQGGSITDARKRPITNSDTTPAPSSPGWYLSGLLPVADSLRELPTATPKRSEDTNRK